MNVCAWDENRKVRLLDRVWRAKRSGNLFSIGATLLLGLPTLHAQTEVQEVPEANPARPTVPTPATPTPIGYLQFENGGLFGTNSPEITPCCIVSMGLAAVAHYKVVGGLTAAHLFTASDHFGKTFRRLRSAFLPKPVERPEPAPFKILHS